MSILATANDEFGVVHERGMVKTWDGEMLATNFGLNPFQVIQFQNPKITQDRRRELVITSSI